MFVNDLFKVVNNDECKMIMYADDTVVYTSSQTLDEGYKQLERNLSLIIDWGPLHKGFSLLIPHFNSSYPCTKPICIAHQTFPSPPCHKKSPCFIRGIAQSASSRLNVGVKCTHRLELALW